MTEPEVTTAAADLESGESELEATAADHPVGEMLEDPHAPTVHHPNPSTYVGVALILAVVTAAEIGLFYVENVSSSLITLALLVLMVIKFMLVALWFMHLRFDAPIFRRLFYGGIVLALSVYAVVLASSHVFPVGT